MEKKWIQDERSLWDQMMYPKRRKISLHSLPPDRRRKLREKIAEQRDAEFAAGWAAYHRWISHQ